MRILYQSCPLCKSTNLTKGPVGDATKHQSYKPQLPSTLQWLDCDNCGHQFTESYWTEEALGLIFQVTRADQMPLHDFGKNREIAARMVERVSDSFHDKWLDIGAGSGTLMLTAKEYSYDVYGTELRKITRDALLSLGLNVSQEIPPHKYSVISACDVLEHVPFPLETLQEWREYAHKGTKLLLSCPNRDHHLWSILHDNPYLYELEHYHNFGFKILRELLYKSGWAHVKYGISERYLLGMELVAEAV